MIKIISDILGGLIMSVTDIYVWHRLYNKKINFKDHKIYIAGLLFAIVCTLNYYYVNNYIKIFVITLFSVFINAYLFEKRDNKILIAPIISEFLILVGEALTMVIAYIVFGPKFISVIDTYFGTLYLNLFIGLLTCFFGSLNWPRILFRKLIKLTDKISEKYMFGFFSLIVIIANFFITFPHYEINKIYVILINAVIIILYTFITFKMLEQKNNNIKISNKYNIVNTSLKEVEQNVTRLKISNHENKNQLLTIRNMLKKKNDINEVITHIDKIVKQKVEDDEHLMFQTSTIMNTMISSIIYSKMLTMKENDIKADLLIDRDIRELDLGDMDEELSIEVCKIIGVYLDNAIEEVDKLEEKIINIELYCDKKSLCIAISNNYNSEIDIEKLDNPGYTTKDSGHGYGLSLVKEIIDSNNKLSSKTEVNNNIFKQILKIKM